MATLYEYVGNMHMHTPYSDGEASHQQIADAALAANLDFVIVTDHNVLVQGVEGYYGDDKRGYVLLLTGEEIHDRQRLPQVNHLLVFGAEMELAQCAGNPQELIDAASAAGGLSFLAHPDDNSLNRFHEPGIPWADRFVERFNGLEIWNYMSRFKDLLDSSMRQLLQAAFRPEELVEGPHPATLDYWDELLAQGKRIVGIGNSDAHGTTYRLGPIQHVVFPYDYLFSCVNTHVLSAQPFTGDWRADRQVVYKALRQGSAFIGYDLPGSTRGFRFSANGVNSTAIMGGSIRVTPGSGVTLQALTRERCHIKIIRHGTVVAESTGRENLTCTVRQGGAYRVEVWKQYKGRERCWILSNPIYVEDVNYAAR